MYHTSMIILFGFGFGCLCYAVLSLLVHILGCLSPKEKTGTPERAPKRPEVRVDPFYLDACRELDLMFPETPCLPPNELTGTNSLPWQEQPPKPGAFRIDGSWWETVPGSERHSAVGSCSVIRKILN
jgi:hypothetical protein